MILSQSVHRLTLPACKGAGRTLSDHTVCILNDGKHFVQESFPALSVSCQQVYSMVLFAPSETVLRKHFVPKLPGVNVQIKTFHRTSSDAPLQTFYGHEKGVRTVAFSTDDKRIASGSADTTIRLWDVVSGAHLNTLTGHSDSVNSVVFSPNGKSIASGSSDETIRLWDAVNGTHLNTLRGHSKCVNSVAFSLDSTCIASGSNDNTIRLWDAVNGAHLNTLRGHQHSVRSVVFSPKGKHIASGSNDEVARVWKTSSGECRRRLGGLGLVGPVASVVYSPNGEHIASGYGDGSIRLWDGVHAAHSLQYTFERISRGRVTSVVFSPDSKQLASGSMDGTIQLWDTVNHTHLTTLKGHSHEVNAVVFSIDGARIASGSDDGTIRLWGVVSGAHLKTLEGHSSSVSSVAFSIDGTLAPGSLDTIRFSPKGTHIASGSQDKIHLWDAVSIPGRGLPKADDAFSYSSIYLNPVIFSPKGTLIASAHGNTIQLWDAVSGVHLQTLSGHSKEVCSVVFFHEGTRIASGSVDQTIRLWDPVSGKCIQTLEGPEGVVSVVFSPDDKLLASGYWDGTTRLWNAVSGAHIMSLKNELPATELPATLSVAFSPDATRFASTGLWSINLWDTVSGAHLKSFYSVGHADIRSIVFSSDGQQLASGSVRPGGFYHQMQLWDAVNGDRIATHGNQSGPVSTSVFSMNDHYVTREWGAVACEWCLVIALDQ